MQQGLGPGKRAKQFSKQITRQIEFSDAFKTKIGSCPVQAAADLFCVNIIWWKAFDLLNKMN